MAVTITLNLTELFDADDDTDFTASQGSPDLDTDLKLEGTASVTTELRTAGVQWVKYTRPTGSWNLSNTHLYIWFNCIFTTLLDTTANGGIRILVGDGTNVGHWYVAGIDTYAGGFVCLVVNTARSFDWNDGADPSISAITEVGVAVNFTASGKLMESTFVDVARYGDGITITSDALCDLDDIIAISENNTYASGILRKAGGVFFAQGKLRFGDASSGSIYFADKNQVIIFEDKPVAATLYEILVQGNAAGTTEFKLGEKANARGISGCYIKAANPSIPFDFTATDTDIDKLQIYCSNFINADSIQLPPNATNRELLGCCFEACGEVLADTCVLQHCNFISSTGRAVRLISASHNVTYCSFINCQTGFHATSTATLSFNALSFVGCTYDGYNSSGSAITVNYDAECSPPPSTYDPAGDAITYQTSVSLTIRHVKSGNEPAEYARVAIYRQSDMYEILNADADVVDDQNPTYYKKSTTWSQSGIAVIVRARETGYLPFEVILTIPSGGLDVTAVWIPDPNYNP